MIANPLPEAKTNPNEAPTNVPPAQVINQPLEAQPANVALANAALPESEFEQAETAETLEIGVKIFEWLVKGIGIGLTIQGVIGTYKSIQFIFFELPILQESSRLGEISQTEINTIMAGAVISAISTMISIFFGLKLTVLKSKAASYISLAISIFFFIANTGLTKHVTDLHIGELLANFIASLIS